MVWVRPYIALETLQLVILSHSQKSTSWYCFRYVCHPESTLTLMGILSRTSYRSSFLERYNRTYDVKRIVCRGSIFHVRSTTNWSSNNTGSCVHHLFNDHAYIIFFEDFLNKNIYLNKIKINNWWKYKTKLILTYISKTILIYLELEFPKGVITAEPRSYHQCVMMFLFLLIAMNIINMNIPWRPFNISKKAKLSSLPGE